MFDNALIQPCFTNLVGYVQSSNANHQIDASLTVSTSGLFVNALPGVQFDISVPSVGSDYTDLDDYLTKIYSQEVSRLLNNVVNRSKNLTGVKEILTNYSLISGVPTRLSKETANARFVGYRITPVDSNNLLTAVTNIALQLDTIQDNPLRLYLYETSQNSAIATFNFQNVEVYSLLWQEVTDFITNYQSLNYGTGQQYLLGYYEADPENPQNFQLQGQAYNMKFTGCNGCGGTSVSKVWSKYVGIQSIAFPNSTLKWNGTDYDLPDIDNMNSYVTNDTYGIQLKVNVNCDLSQIICANKQVLSEALQLSLAIRILDDNYASININNVTDPKRVQSQDLSAMYNAKLWGGVSKSGVKISGIIDNVSIDFSGLDRFCSPCKKGVYFQTWQG